MLEPVRQLDETRRRYEAGELTLPSVLAAAETVRRALDATGDVRAVSRGTIVVATLEGDVHHIGKALLVSLLGASGYTVHDLGMQVPIARIVDAAIETGADAIGLSALLLTTSEQMGLCVQELDRRGVRVPVLVGGAAINRSFGRRAAMLPDGRIYEPGVFYCRDVFEGLSVLEALADSSRRPDLIARTLAEISAERDPAARVSAPAMGVGDKSQLAAANVPVPPFWGGRRLDPDLREVWEHLDRNTLFRHHWGGFHAKGADYDRLVHDEFEPLLSEMQQDALANGWLEPRVVMGYFPCEAAGDRLLVYHPTRPERVVRVLEFPRQADSERLCMTDYFRAEASGERDVIALQAVTVGSTAGELIERLQRAGEYRRMLYVNGLASSTAEALAEYVFQLVRRELELEPRRGLRFSWGYPACPDLFEQEKVLTLIGAAAEIDVTLSQTGNLEPEHSTAAMVVHHPAAKYFSV
jgi:5-methyltetrahydrofolate--homocysteine methyltransferase